MPDKRMYVEKRLEEGDYAVRRAGSKRASDVKPTQEKAIKRSKQIEPKSKPRVERVRKTAKGGPDKWRAVTVAAWLPAKRKLKRRRVRRAPYKVGRRK
jgi:hypothetical protein